MRIRDFQMTDRTVVLGLVAAYAAIVVIGLSILLSTAIWPAVSHAL